MGKDLAPIGRATLTDQMSGFVVSLATPSETSTRSFARLKYIRCDVIGFEYVPEQVVRQLREGNVIAGAEIAAWAEPPVAKRRKDGSAYQVVADAWWADRTKLVVFKVVRSLEDLGEDKLRPTGPWVPRGTVYELPSGVSAVRYSSPPESGGSGKGSGGTAADAEDPLDVLPEHLQPPLRGGVAGARIEWGRKWARETVVAQRLDAGRVRVLRAERQGKNEQSLTNSMWTITSLEAPVARSWQMGPAPFASSAARRREQQQAHPVEASRTFL